MNPDQSSTNNSDMPRMPPANVGTFGTAQAPNPDKAGPSIFRDGEAFESQTVNSNDISSDDDEGDEVEIKELEAKIAECREKAKSLQEQQKNKGKQKEQQSTDNQSHKKKMSRSHDSSEENLMQLVKQSKYLQDRISARETTLWNHVIREEFNLHYRQHPGVPRPEAPPFLSGFGGQMSSTSGSTRGYNVDVDHDGSNTEANRHYDIQKRNAEMLMISNPPTIFTCDHPQCLHHDYRYGFKREDQRNQHLLICGFRNPPSLQMNENTRPVGAQLFGMFGSNTSNMMYQGGPSNLQQVPQVRANPFHTSPMHVNPSSSFQPQLYPYYDVYRPVFTTLPPQIPLGPRVQQQTFPFIGESSNQNPLRADASSSHQHGNMMSFFYGSNVGSNRFSKNDRGYTMQQPKGMPRGTTSYDQATIEVNQLSGINNEFIYDPLSFGYDFNDPWNDDKQYQGGAS